MSDRVRRPSVVLLLTAFVVASGYAQQPTGGLHVRLDQTPCSSTDEIGVYKVTTPADGSGGQFIRKLLAGQTSVTRDCAWTLGDLVPGDYEVWFQRAGERVAVRPVTIVADQTADVALTADVVVSGYVAFNGEPFDGVNIEFAPKRGSRRYSASAVTDAAGVYQAFLADEGTYTVVFQRNKAIVLGQDQEGTAHAGTNRVDWLLEGGTLRVMPVGWDRKERLSLWIERQEHTGTWYATAVAADADRLPLTLTGLAFGTYEIRWMDVEHTRDMSGPAVVALDAQARDRSVQLTVWDKGPRF
jgi:hypothetical protein